MRNYSECSICPAKNSSKCNTCTYSDRRDLKEAYDNNDSEFLNSFIIGAATGSTLAGAFLGGDFMGAALGDFFFGDD